MDVKKNHDPKSMERLRRMAERYPELAPLLDTCRSVEEIEEAIRELSRLGW